MRPANTANVNIEVIEVLSESEPEVIEISEGSEAGVEEPPFKRQKRPSVEPPKKAAKKPRTTQMDTLNNKNAHLKGRKRFKADLEDMSQLCASGYAMSGFAVTDCQSGEDEGSVNVVLSLGPKYYPITLLISDTSEYPKSHACFASTEADVPSGWKDVLSDLSDGRSAPIDETLRKLLQGLERVSSSAKTTKDTDDEGMSDDDEDDGSEEDYTMYDDFYAFDSQPTTHRDNIRRLTLQSDWNRIYAHGYRPGFIKFGGDDFAITVSLPIISLTNMIPPQALMAWDSLLLSRSQSLCLIISGCRGIYPPLNPDGRYAPGVSALTFKVGLTKRYKPSTEHARDAGRSFHLMTTDAEDEVKRAEEAKRQQAMQDEMLRRLQEMEENGETGFIEPIIVQEEEELEDEGSFDKFSLSNSMESLLDSIFLKVLQLRRQFNLGWAGAEALHLTSEREQIEPALLFHRNAKAFTDADELEKGMEYEYRFPVDPLAGCAKDSDINLPLTAFSYLLRRLMLCTRHCLVCFNPIDTNFQALKPYVCGSKLCGYQYYSLNHGPSLEYEICRNPMGVDLLVSMAYCAAQEGVLDDPLPIGLGIRIPMPTAAVKQPPKPHTATLYPQQPPSSEPVKPPPALDANGLCDFDDLNKQQMRAAIVELINQLPSIETMKRHLERKVGFGKRKPVLRECEPSVSAAAWLVLRWIVASCTAYLEETQPEERVRNIDDSWRQFRLSVGAPDAEAKFQRAISMAMNKDKNAKKYPSIYAFHGSGMRNWHSILRHGLWYKQVSNGRAYGDGVYFAKDPSVSMHTYAAGAGAIWKNSRISPSNCAAIAEIVNLPKEFRSSNPYLVVPQTEWIMCRHLLVKGAEIPAQPTERDRSIPLVPLDPAHPLTIAANNNKPKKAVEIPQPSYRINTLLSRLRLEWVDDPHDEEDTIIFSYEEPASQEADTVIVEDNQMNQDRPSDDWQHDSAWVQKACSELMPPPEEASPSATMALTREFKLMMKEQNSAKSLRDLGWYMPIEFNEDNLFQWVVEMHSFDPDLPISKDLKTRGVNSILFEIRYPPTFPNSPPFFRVITPRFLPFIQGGGGHVTGGGSICMDLLTADGWLPSYSISAVLMQIKLAISNPDPRPARLASNWHNSYSPMEALEGYKRAAMTHNWKIPAGLDRLVTK